MLFAQLVNDPGYQREIGYGVNRKEAEVKREKLFQIIRDLVKWENTNNEEVLSRAREAIWESWRETCLLNRNHPKAAELFNPDKLPAFHDPFAGGGAIPLEAQRLGLESHASDLNPVAVMINKAMIEIPPKFAGQSRLLGHDQNSISKIRNQRPAMPLKTGLRTGRLSRRRAPLRPLDAGRSLQTHWPPLSQDENHPDMVVKRPDLKAYEGKDLTVIAWLWARTVKSPNPAFSDIDVPLVRSFVLSNKKGKRSVGRAGHRGKQLLRSKDGKQPSDASSGNHRTHGATCIMSQTAMPFKYVRAEAKAGRMGERLMAIVAEGVRGRVYLSLQRKLSRLQDWLSLAVFPKQTCQKKLWVLGFRNTGCQPP